MSEDLLSTAKEMSNLELDYSLKLASSASGMANAVVKAVMYAVSKDSEKHSLLYKVVEEMLRSPGRMLSEEESRKILEEIERHIRTEEEMLKKVMLMLEKSNLNKATRFILELILRDEALHHAMLRRVYEMIVKRETLTESDLWDMVWKDVPYHGAPGG
ncbi:MAG: ferritin-like domain-containing protein [Thermoproteota archaeon]